MPLEVRRAVLSAAQHCRCDLTVVKPEPRLGLLCMHHLKRADNVVIVLRDDRWGNPAHQRRLCAYSKASGGCSRHWARAWMG
jgi:hypothetical protein